MPEQERPTIQDLVEQPPDPRDPVWGWSSLAEILLDESNWVPKPKDPTGQNLHRVHRHAGIGEYTEIVLSTLARMDLEDKVPEFINSINQYREDIKKIVKVWREKGML